MTSQYILLAIGVAIALIAGVADARSPEKLVGGHIAEPNQFPYHVSLRLNNKHICGGSILGGRHVLTAARCLVNVVSSPFSNLVIATNTSIMNSPTYAVDKIFYESEKEVDNTTMNYDIAIIVLKQEIDLVNSGLRALSVATTLFFKGSTGATAGYESTPEPTDSYVLKYLRVGFWYPEDCQYFYNAINTVQYYEICGVTVGHEDCAFNTDVGSSLVIEDQYFGILTYSYPCGTGKPDTYINLVYFAEWIEEIISTT